MKMFLQLSLLAIIVIISAYLAFHFLKTSFSPNQQQGILGSVCFSNRCFQVEVEGTVAQREQGLMYRKELDKDKGMLFIFDKEGTYPFWMKNTLIPLDMIWMNEVGRVVFIAQNVQPCKNLVCPSIIPTDRAKYVLEVNAGICKDIGLKVGDTMTISTK